MAPRTRSHRAEFVAREEILSYGDQPPNREGLYALPDEIYLGILSHLPTVPIPTLSRSSIKEESHRDRHQTLLAVSQTCRSLRRFFLRYLWQRIEVYDCMQTSKGALAMTYPKLTPGRPREKLAHKKHAEELVRQLEIVTIREPSFALHVNVLNASVLEFSAKTVVEELARCIALLPNLHTVQLTFSLNFDSHQFLNDLFMKYVYPQVRSATLSGSAVYFLLACPEVRCVNAYMNTTWDGYWEEVFLPPSIEVLGTIPFQRDVIIKTVKKLPNLREITLDPSLLLLGRDKLKPLSELQHLHIIRLGMNVCPPKRYFLHLPGNCLPYRPDGIMSETTQWVKWAKDILAEIRPDGPGSRRVILVDKNGQEAMYKVS